VKLTGNLKTEKIIEIKKLQNQKFKKITISMRGK